MVCLGSTAGRKFLRRRYGRRGFGHLFGVLFLLRHPLLLLVVAAVILVVHLYRRRH